MENKPERSSDNIKEENLNSLADDFSQATISEENNFENDNSTPEEKLFDDDFIDEDALKEKELGYSEEDKIRFKAEADEYKVNGNQQFKSCEYKESISTYTLGLRTCPLSYTKERSILYSNRAAAKSKLGYDVSAIDDCSKAIELDPSYIRAILRRAQLYESTDKLDESLEDFKKVLELDPSNKDAIIACQKLPPLINERNEKMKDEMLGKLKDLGNVFLRPFGLSTENFKMSQDPQSGGYSIQFNGKS